MLLHSRFSLVLMALPLHKSATIVQDAKYTNLYLALVSPMFVWGNEGFEGLYKFINQANISIAIQMETCCKKHLVLSRA